MAPIESESRSGLGSVPAAVSGLEGVGSIAPFDLGLLEGFLADGGIGTVLRRGYRKRAVHDCIYIYSWYITKARASWIKFAFECVDIHLKYVIACAEEKSSDGDETVVQQCFFKTVSDDDLSSIDIAKLFLEKFQVVLPPPQH